MMEPVTGKDRVLLLGLSDPARPRQFAAAFAVVGMGTETEVYAARRACADLANFMFVRGDRDDIPWDDRWFTVIVVEGDAAPTASMTRVLADGGRIVAL